MARMTLTNTQEAHFKHFYHHAIFRAMSITKKIALPISLLFGIVASAVSSNNYFIVLGFVLGIIVHFSIKNK
jgi:hypothetical protein